MENKHICEVCGCESPYMAETSDGRFICDDCIEDAGYFWCEECNTYHPNEEMTDVFYRRRERISVCETCANNRNLFFYCESCGEYYNVDFFSAHETRDYGTLCESCYDDRYTCCENCGTVISYDNAYQDDDDDCYYCTECAESRRQIRSYNYKPKAKCKGKGKGLTETIEFEYPEDCKELLLGAELEIDYGDSQSDTASDLNKACPDIYIKRDGSLCSNGLEIVSHPCTLEYHMTSLGWDKICDIARKHHYRSHDARTCGLHVHVGRYQLGKTDEERINTAAKIVMLVDRHWNEMMCFSRRRRNQLEEWASPPKLEIANFLYWENLAIDKALETIHRGRYQAVNLTNYNTIEFRLFNGSLVPNTIIATLQLVSNICEFAKTHSVDQCLASSWSAVTDHKVYMELQSYLKGRGMTEVENTPIVFLTKEPKFSNEPIVKGDEVCIVSGSYNSLYGRRAVVTSVNESYFETYYTIKFDEVYDTNYGVMLTTLKAPSNMIRKLAPIEEEKKEEEKECGWAKVKTVNIPDWDWI